MHRSFVIFVLLFANSAAKNGGPKEKIKLHKLSDEEPGTKDYDHEAFLGEETSQQFDMLDPKEARRRLGIIFDKIDMNHDGIIDEKEIEKWINFSQERHMEEDTNKRLAHHDLDKNGLVHWDEFYKLTFGGLKDDDWKTGESEGFSYEDMHKRDKTRWEAADTDDDNSCTKTELKAFFHPQYFPHMRDIVFAETMADIDLNNDGFLDMEEYINDVYQPQYEGEQEPDWVATEREQFVNERDKDQDGKLSEEEIRAWIMPAEYNYALAEAKHLVFESDTDRDGFLTKDEMNDHYDTFVGSQATQWGKILERHDEF